jgi:uncharacterized DUF497 family protein
MAASCCNLCTVTKWVPPAKKEVLHEETADIGSFGFICSLYVLLSTRRSRNTVHGQKRRHSYRNFKKIGVSVQTIKKVNNLSGHKLKPGQILSLKKKSSTSRVSVKSKSTQASHYKVRKGDTLSGISKRQASRKTTCRSQ